MPSVTRAFSRRMGVAHRGPVRRYERERRCALVTRGGDSNPDLEGDRRTALLRSQGLQGLDREEPLSRSGKRLWQLSQSSTENIFKPIRCAQSYSTAASNRFRILRRSRKRSVWRVEARRSNRLQCALPPALPLKSKKLRPSADVLLCRKRRNTRTPKRHGARSARALLSGLFALDYIPVILYRPSIH